jgi:hypothetical protein
MVVFPLCATEVHVSIASHEISGFIETHKRMMTCFRCGQVGHTRHQCLTYKVRLCDKYARGECCAPSCTFAHEDAELRTPWSVRCVRVVQHDGEMVCLGCNSTEHTFRKCPVRRHSLMFV